MAEIGTFSHTDLTIAKQYIVITHLILSSMQDCTWWKKINTVLHAKRCFQTGL